MAYIEMPKLSDTMTEGTLVKWCKKPGDKVEVGDVIAEVETDKATMEMEAFDDGELVELLVQEGQTVKLGERMAVLKIQGEELETAPASSQDQKSIATASAASSSQPSAQASPGPTTTPASSNGERIKISPLARKVAAERGVDPRTLQGSGPGGRIIQRDVLGSRTGQVSAQKSAATPSVAPATKVLQPVPVATGPESTSVPLSNMRKVIAERLLASKTQIPHFYLFSEVDAAPLMKLRAQLNAAGEAEGIKFTINDLILKAAVLAAVQVPRVNVSFTPQAIVQYHRVHLSVAIAVEDGLVTPVIRNAETKSLREINAAVKDLAARAKAKKLKPDEFQGGTITVSNLGAFGVDRFAAIINPPQSIILAVGAIVKKAVVDADDQIVIGHRLDLGLSCDHRTVDGAIGAEYLSALRKLIENPTLMLI